MEDLYVIQTPNGFGRAHMRWDGSNCWYLEMIEIPEADRGEGFGSQLLQQVLDAADAEGARLMLVPARPCYESIDAMGTVQLARWYQRRGFHHVKGSNRFVRQPQRTICVQENSSSIRDFRADLAR